MAGNDIDKDFLIHELVRAYAEKIFYYCLKKTGDDHEAEDLASDILLNCIAQLGKGNLPVRFYAWVWQIARNRYSVWAGKKRRRSEWVSGDDIGELEFEDRAADPEEAAIRDAELRLMRRELAFISSDYRSILVAYYMQGRKISQIALSLGLPEGTVTSRLHRARKTLKEGMDMAREFGKRSYDPETISFISSGSQPSGLPWTAVERKLPVNILCEAHNNPCTLQELALELGIAAPYMEEEVELLVKAELLKKMDNGTVLTSFFISPRECQNEINEIVCSFAEKHAAAFWHLAGKALEKARELGVTTGGYSDEDAWMYFAFCLTQQIEKAAFSDDIYGKFKRADGGDWGMIGYEQGAVRRLPSAFFNNSGNRWNGMEWNGFQALPGDDVFIKRRYGKDVPDGHLNITLREIAKGTSPEDLSEAEKENLRELLEEGFCVRRGDGNACVNALVFKGDMEIRLFEYLKALPEYASLREDMGRFIGSAREVVARYSNKYLQDDFEYYVAMSAVSLRSTLSRLWKDSGLYTGESAQFCGFFC